MWFSFRFSKYYFDENARSFIPIEFDYYKPYQHIHDSYAKGVQEGEEHLSLVDQYGKCNIILPEKGIFKLLIEEILNPFYIFQFFSIVLWFFDSYTEYACCIIFTTLLSITTELIDIVRNLRNLRKMAYYE